MTNRYEIVWIDDDGSRKKSAENLERKSGSKVFFYNVTNKDLADKLDEIFKKHKPDLVIVDHKLDKTNISKGKSLRATGATVAEVIKDTFHQIPIICVTKVDVDSNEITFSQKSAYDYVVNSSKFHNHYDVIISIAEGFRRLKGMPVNDRDGLLKLLDCPKDDSRRLEQVLPTDLKTGFSHSDYASRLWKWVLNIFFEYAGFLYDDLWAATLVGAKLKSFHDASDRLKPAKYNGIFACDTYQRWWPTRISNLVWQSEFSKNIHDIRKLGRAFLSIPQQGYSKCEISNQDLPNTVAFTDASPTNKKRVQVCIEFTEEHPNFQKLLFFEEKRILKEES